jgi:tRNA(fMet)-specific endonuclease VapC
MRFMLDTNICIYIIKKNPPQAAERVRALSPFEIGISSVTLAELEYGVAKSSRPERNKEALASFLAPLEIASFDDFAAIHYGEIRAHLEKSGLSIGAMDLMIASHARSLDVILVSNNPREFQRVPGLKIENWV